MLPGRPRPRTDEPWIDRLAPKVAGLREALRWISAEVIADRSGAVPDGGVLRLEMLFEPYTIHPDTYVVRRPDGPEPSSFVEALVLTYLHTADGAPAEGRWVSFRDLPDGGFYHAAFQGYTGDRLVAAWGHDVARFATSCRTLGGDPIELGDAGFRFPVLPRLDAAVAYWQGEEDLPSRASLLFDASAPHYMVTDGLAILGSHLVGKLLKQ